MATAVPPSAAVQPSAAAPSDATPSTCPPPAGLRSARLRTAAWRGDRSGARPRPRRRRYVRGLLVALMAAALTIGGTAVAGAAPGSLDLGGLSGSAGSVPQSGDPTGPTGSLGSLAPGSGRVDFGTGVNPVVLPIAADPSVVRAPDGTFYLYATSDDWQDGGGMHHLPIFRSTNLVDWTVAGNVFSGKPGWVDPAGGLWAPDVHLVDDTYVVYYSVGGTANPCIGMATSVSPTGPFTDLGRPVFCSSDVGVPGTIDPSVYYDGATPYVFVGNFGGIYAIPLTHDGTAVAGDDPKAAPVRVAGNGYEAPYIQHKNGYYYLYVSAGNCCNGAASDYRVYVGRSQNLLGPYVDSSGQPMLDEGGDLILSGNVTWLGPGHITVVTDDAGTDWAMYHAAPRAAPRLGAGPQNREGMIDKISWVGDWPRIGDGTPSSTAPAVPYIGGV